MYCSPLLPIPYIQYQIQQENTNAKLFQCPNLFQTIYAPVPCCRSLLGRLVT